MEKISAIKLYLEKRFEGSDAYEIEHLRKDWEQKERSALGVFNDFKKRIGDPIGKRVLDMGFGNGVIACEFSKNGAIVSGVEVDQLLFDCASEYAKENGVDLSLSLYDGCTLPYEDDSFDYIFSTSVLEHVDNPSIFLKEASRVLVAGGKMYLAFPNRFSLRDSHSGVYFLGLLPRPVGQLLLRILGKKSFENWNLHFLSYFSFLRILRKNRIPFKVVMEAVATSKLRFFIKKFLAFFGIHYGALLPQIIVILKKHDNF